ncbi:MAG: hypothetical protein ACE5GW_13580, partial [Planctomycetota bacterium]
AEEPPSDCGQNRKLILDLQTRLAEELRCRVDRALSRFRERVEGLIAGDSLTALGAGYPAQRGVHSDGLGDPRWEEKWSALSSGVRSLTDKVEAVAVRIAGLASAGRGRGADGREIAEAFHRGLQPLREQLERIENRTAGSSGDATIDLITGIPESVGRRLDALGSDIMERLTEGLEEARRIAPEAAPGGARPEDSAGLLESLGEIKERLAGIAESMPGDRAEGADLAPFLEHLEKIEAELPDRSRPLKAVEERLGRLEDLIRELPDPQSSEGAGEPDGSLADEVVGRIDEPLGEEVIDQGSELLTALKEVPPAGSAGGEDAPGGSEILKDLKKEFSFLVHTINGHLEESRNRSKQLDSSFGGVMGGLDELRNLPERIAALLNASNEVQQFGITSSIEEALNRLTARVEEVAEKARG